MRVGHLMLFSSRASLRLAFFDLDTTDRKEADEWQRLETQRREGSTPAIGVCVAGSASFVAMMLEVVVLEYDRGAFGERWWNILSR